MCTVFGLEEDEVASLIKAGFKMTDHNKEDEGFEVKNSAFKVLLPYFHSFFVHKLSSITTIADARVGQELRVRAD